MQLGDFFSVFAERPSATPAALISNPGCHLISLQLGGDPNDYRNLWVEPADPGNKKGSGVNAKDSVETKLHTAVCKGTVTLAASQQAIVTDWTAPLSKFSLA